MHCGPRSLSNLYSKYYLQRIFHGRPRCRARPCKVPRTRLRPPRPRPPPRTSRDAYASADSPVGRQVSGAPTNGAGHGCAPLMPCSSSRHPSASSCRADTRAFGSRWACGSSNNGQASGAFADVWAFRSFAKARAYSSFVSFKCQVVREVVEEVVGRCWGELEQQTNEQWIGVKNNKQPDDKFSDYLFGFSVLPATILLPRPSRPRSTPSQTAKPMADPVPTCTRQWPSAATRPTRISPPLWASAAQARPRRPSSSLAPAVPAHRPGRTRPWPWTFLPTDPAVHVPGVRHSSLAILAHRGCKYPGARFIPST